MRVWLSDEGGVGLMREWLSDEGVVIGMCIDVTAFSLSLCSM